MPVVSLLVSLLPSIVNLIGIAENALAHKPKSGPEKKALVMHATEAIIGGITAASSGVQKATWEKIATPISNIVDNTASMMFPGSEAQ